MRKLLFTLLIFSSFLLIYYPVLFNFFAQDDFSLLLVSQAKNLKEFLLFFRPLKTGIFYRPLSMQLYFFLTNTLFGLRPLAFHLVAFIFHLANIFLVYLLIKIITKNKLTALCVSFCFAVSSIHFMSLFWICEFSLILSAFFSLLAFINYLNKKPSLFMLFFLLALLSNESTATLPFVILSYEFVFKRRFVFRKLFLPLSFIICFILLRFFFFPTSLGEFYKFEFSLSQFLSNLRWYLLRSLSLPELIKDFLRKSPLLKINLLSSLIFLVSGFLIPTLFLSKKKKLDLKILLFAFLWFTLSLLPVIFMPKHLLSSYLTLGLPGILLFWLNGLSSMPKKLKRPLVLISFSSFFLSSLLSVRFLQEHHWIVYRAKLAEQNLKPLLEECPKFEKNDLIYFKNTKPEASKELYLAMAGEAAVKVFCKPTLKVFFEDFYSLTKEETQRAHVVPVITF